jgi:thioredoxin reductase (NADPH)
MSEFERIKCLIIGSGPGGYTAAIYAARADLKPVVLEGMQAGGQLTITTEIENFPGYPEGVEGSEMMEQIKQQAQRFGTEVRPEVVVKADFSSRPFRIETDNGSKIEAESVIIATGASARWLGLESEQKFMGMGVSACATCDGFFYRNQEVAVVGGGDTACEEASYLANICKKVYLIVRRDELRASKAMQERVKANPKIEIVWNHKPNEVLGDDSGVTAFRLEHSQTGELKEIAVTGIFLAIGHKPNTDFLAGQIELNKEGYIITQDKSSKTNIEGVFAAGDVCDPTYRQAIVAAGSGCKAAMDCERFLLANPLA